MRILPAEPPSIQEAVRHLREGGIVAYPTETVYGLGVNPADPHALAKLFQCKGRAESNPVLLIVAEDSQLAPWVEQISPAAQACMDAFWPGPLSILFPKAKGAPDALTANSPWICARCPGNAFARDLCLAFGGAITSTSANRSGETPATAVSELSLEGISLALDGGLLPPSPPSTIVNPETGDILRAGAISVEAVRAVLHF